MRVLSIFATLALALVGCASKPGIYSWGHYEDQVYLMYAKPDKAGAETQALKMEEDFQKARSTNKPMHPGFHAHLGYLYYQLGKTELARQQFESEKAQFPESAVLMDRLLATLKKP